jgi:hypothetical protein
MQAHLDRWGKCGGQGLLTKSVGSLHEVVHPLLYCACSDLGPQPMTVVPPIKARDYWISLCFPLHYPRFIDFLDLLYFNPFFMRFTTPSFIFQVLRVA